MKSISNSRQVKQKKSKSGPIDFNPWAPPQEEYEEYNMFPNMWDKQKIKRYRKW